MIVPGERMERPRKLRAGHRAPRTDFAKFVAELPRPVGRLGLTHVTTGYIIREIVDASAIVAVEDCPVLNEPLIYAFYGRVAFRKGGDQAPSDLHFLFPVVLVLDPEKLPSPKYVFGFDSGAFMHGMMDGHLDPDMPLFDFHVDADIGAAAAIAEHFFGGSAEFLGGRIAPAVEVPPSNFEATSYLKIVRASGSGSNSLDDRASTPEVTFADRVPVEGVVKAAILPDVLAGDEQIGGRLAALGVSVREYQWSSGTRPSEYHMQIRRLVEGLYEEFGWSHVKANG